MPTRIIALALIATTAAIGTTTLQDDLPVVRVAFQNTTDGPVDIFLLEEPGEDGAAAQETLFAPQLPVGKQFLQTTPDAVTYRIRSADQIVADYVVNSTALQIVDIQEAADWQVPVTMVFQNTTSEPIDIEWIGDEPRDIAQGLPSQREITSTCLPGDLWRISQGGVGIAEIVASSHKEQIVDVAELVKWFQPVKLLFQNSTDGPVTVHWVDPVTGSETCYTRIENGTLRPLPNGRQMTQEAQPMSMWRVRQQDGDLLAEYSADSSPLQIIEVRTEE